MKDGSEIPLIPIPKCKFCSKPVPDRFSEWECCRDCTDRMRAGLSGNPFRPYAFIKVMAVGIYVPDIPGKGTLGSFVVDMKHDHDRSDEVMEAMMMIISEEAKDRTFDIVIPVPTSDNLLGPSMMISRKLSVLMGIPNLEAIHCDGVQARSKDLIGEEKFYNVMGKVRIDEGTDLSSKRILLVDDIVTTCGTAHWCSEELLRAGASSVHVVSICRTVSKKHLDFVGYDGRY